MEALMNNSSVYFVSPQGRDSNPGTVPELAFATLDRAKEAVREARRSGLKSDITVYLRGGEYYLDHPLSFDERDGGNGRYKIIYKNFAEEMPVINGGATVTGWEPCREGIYKAKVEKGRVFHTLYENGTCCTKARYPKQGYHTVAGMVEETPRRKFRFNPGDLPPIENQKELQVFIWSGGPEGEWNWFSNVIGIEEVDYRNGIVTLSSEAAYEMGAGSRYYIQGAFELLSAPGEFYLDTEEGELYYRPRSEDIYHANIVVPKMERVVEWIGSSPEQPVQGIVLEGVTLRNTDTVHEIVAVTSEDGAVQNGTLYLENAAHIEIRNCIIHNTGLHGVYLNGAVSFCSIRGNHIYDIGHTGIQVQGYCFSSRDVSHRNVIRNNHICRCGRLVGHGAGVQLVQSGSNTVSHNRIHHTPRYSISLKLWPAGHLAGKTIDGVVVTRENAIDFSFTRNNVIEFNDVSHANTDSQDTGLMESWGAGHGNIIRNNRLHDSEIHFSFGVGLYLDDASNYFQVYNNLIHGLQKYGAGKLSHCIYSKGIGNRFYNNIIADNHVSGSAFGTYEMFGEPNRDLDIQRNIFYNSGNYYRFENWSDRRIRRSDYNLLFRSDGEMTVCLKQEDTHPETWLTLEEWRTLPGHAFDSNSLVEDPGFMDPEKGDYRLQSHSPSYRLGFEDFNLQDIGLEADYPYSDPEEELASVFVRRIHDEVNRGWFSLMPGEQTVLEVTARTETGFVAAPETLSVRFSSSDETVAAVDEKGLLKAGLEGTAEITVEVTRKQRTEKTRLYILVQDTCR